MKSSISLLLSFVFLATGASFGLGQTSPNKPIRALLIAGGCCHDYAKQQEALCKGIQARANVQVDVYWTDNSTTAPMLPLYSKLNWAEDYDIIIHDECAADIKDPALLNRIVQTHQKIPAVHLHCAMHSFRAGNDVWFKHLGLQSTGHGPQEPIDIEFSMPKHPITETLSNWTTIREELYNNVKLFDAVPLAVGKQKVGRGDKARIDQAVVVWVNEKQGARSFSTSLGHNTETVADPRYLELVTRGLLWACDKLNEDYLKPFEGKNEVTFIDKNKFSNNSAPGVGNAPKDATLVKVSASSVQDGNPAHHVVDGKQDTRWCADGPAYPASIQLELQEPQALDAIQIAWEMPAATYKYRVEGSQDGKEYSLLIDQTANTKAGVGKEAFASTAPVRFVRVTGLSSTGGWCSIREIQLFGSQIKSLWPADPKSPAGKFTALQGDSYAKSGNIIPRIEKLSPEEEAAILKDVKVADGFEATLFAAPPAVNYPVFVAADVDGTLYVSSDGNGSLGRDPMRGRVIRLRDTDNDGRADETKVFCEVDAPRGLVWDKDRLYLMHPPHLSVFIDHDRDGVADEQKTLVKNLAFDYDKRPADHTTNGLSLGADGWLYIAGGDFGFMDAVGTDGTRLTHRGGGVIRVRPDGTGLEIYSTGTRNILEVAISPAMEMFARDNTNDGGGWDVRLHHFTGNDDHGYPRLYKNFSDECVAPLADYGGGSGCGAVYIDEPGFGAWNQAPFTADWGTNAIYRHTVKPQGATYQETANPEPLVRMTRPTDADVDGNSRVYAASWKGANFNWNGPNVGYIVRIQPKGFQPQPLRDYAKLNNDELVKEMDSASYRRRMEASRELARRGDSRHSQLLAKGLETRNLDRKVLDAIQITTDPQIILGALSHSDPVIVHTAIRILAKRKPIDACLQALEQDSAPWKPLLRALAMMHEPKVVDALISQLSKETKPDRRELLLGALCRLHFIDGEWNGDSWGTRPDTRGPYYQPEAWGESQKILATLRTSLANADSKEAAFLIEAMEKNRIETDEGLERIIEIATKDNTALPIAVAKLATAKEIPTNAVPLLLAASRTDGLGKQTLSQVVSTLARTSNPESFDAMIRCLERLEQDGGDNALSEKARDAFLNSSLLGQNVSRLIDMGKSDTGAIALFADAGLLHLASKSASPEVQAAAQKEIEDAWGNKTRKIRLMRTAGRLVNHHLDEEILAAWKDPDVEVAKVAQNMSNRLKIKQRPEDKSPKLASLALEEALKSVVEMKGDISFGERLFTKAKCSQCHTVRQDEVQKGPYLGNIARTYKRPELATAVLDPSKSIAQGFITNIIQTHDDETITGFVTNEQNDRVMLRDAQGKEYLVMKDNIAARKTSTVSSMPTGLMNEFSVYEFASILDYLESIAK